MGSFTHLTYHVVFGTKYRRPAISEELREPLYQYIGGTLRAKKGCAIEIGGMKDHLHILATLSPTLAVADVVRDLKAASSGWVKNRQNQQDDFQWQKGYGAFTVSYDRIPSVAKYIRNQQEHHQTKTFQEEYIEFLQRHGIEFHIEHLFENEHHG